MYIVKAVVHPFDAFACGDQADVMEQSRQMNPALIAFPKPEAPGQPVPQTGHLLVMRGQIRLDQVFNFRKTAV